MKTAKSSKKPLVVIIAFVGIFLLEALLSNFVWFAYVAGKDYITDFDGVQNEVYTVNPESKFIDFGCGDFPLNSVRFTVRSISELPADILANVRFYVFDENNISSASFVTSEPVTVSQTPHEYTVYINSRGDMTGMSLEVTDITTECEISNIIINPEYKFSFNPVRFAIIALALAAMIFVRSSKGKQLRDEMTFTHAQILACALCCSVAMLFWSFSSSGETGSFIEYPLDGDIRYYSPYIQQLDAFIKGQVHLDIQPSQELLALENPYTPQNREGVDYIYDRAFYDGKYYSYFGIAPILVFFYPYYLITGNFPTDSSVMGFFSLITAIFLPLAVVEWSRLRKSGARAWLSCVTAVGACFASNVLLIQRGRAAFYYVASIAAMAFVSAYIFWLLKALGSKKMLRVVFMIFAGASFSLGFLSRINTVLPVAVVTAAFIAIYFVRAIKEKKFSSFIGDMIPLGIPVAAALAFSLYYNNLRFGNPLQFGTEYQLTLANASLYDARANGLLPALFHYFVQPFSVSSEFPYMTFSYLPLRDYGKQVYIDSNIGLFAVPFMLALLLSPALFKSKKISGEGKAMLGVSLFALILTAYLNFCYGGVIFRYTADMTALAAFVSAVIISEICLILQRDYHDYVSCFAKKAACCVAASTAVISFFSAVMVNINLASFYPAVHTAIRDFFVFWN